MSTPASATKSPPRIGVVIPCYNVAPHILAVLARIGPACEKIYVIDDASTDGTAGLVRTGTTDARVILLTHAANGGVGAAVKTGYRQALADGMTIVVKLDGDGQMAPEDIPRLIAPVAEGRADYAKGNRFFHPEGLKGMPPVRLLGNALLSFITKLSSGYWNVFDPTNGFTAISAEVLARLPLAKVADGFFFESDLLFRLYILYAAVADVPMPARYGAEVSNLRVGRVIPRFIAGNLRNLLKRLLYHYVIRDFSIASVEIFAGLALLSFGTIFGTVEWVRYQQRGVFASSGTIMLAALPVILGIQMLIAFLSYDIAAVPKQPLTGYLPASRGPGRSE
jgi:glycosyltransferase involved in cell wall biosynthesis